MTRVLRLAKRLLINGRIGSRYGKALSLLKKGDASAAFRIISQARDLADQLDSEDPETLAQRVLVTVLYSQAAVEMGQHSEARRAAIEVLEVAQSVDVKTQGTALRNEIEKLEYYANLSPEISPDAKQ